MVALDRALSRLDKHANFSKAFDHLVVERGGFPCGWMTAQQINDELEARGFWSGPRGVVLTESRARLVKRFLDQRCDEFLPSDNHGWQRFDGQYKRNPKTKLVKETGRHLSGSFNRRANRRATVEFVNCQYGPVKNLGMRGVMFLCEGPPEMSVGAKGYLKISHGDVSVRLKVKVLWLEEDEEEGGTRVGCIFRDLKPEDEQTIARIMKSAEVEEDD